MISTTLKLLVFSATVWFLTINMSVNMNLTNLKALMILRICNIAKTHEIRLSYQM